MKTYQVVKREVVNTGDPEFDELVQTVKTAITFRRLCNCIAAACIAMVIMAVFVAVILAGLV